MPGEIADMMLEGVLCEGCGEFIGEGDGFPTYCSPQCAKDRGAEYWQGGMLCEPKPKRHRCATCGRKFRTAHGLQDHRAAKHGPVSQ